MAGKPGGDDDVLADINVTPLVDIMLVLLIIFMLTSEEVSDKMKKPSIEVELPAAASAEIKSAAPLNVVITKDGKLFLNGQAVDEAGLQARVATLVKGAPTLTAVVSADRRVNHGAVLHVIDGLRLLGARHVTINTKEQDIE